MEGWTNTTRNFHPKEIYYTYLDIRRHSQFQKEMKVTNAIDRRVVVHVNDFNDNHKTQTILISIVMNI